VEVGSRVGFQDILHILKRNSFLIFCFVAIGMALATTAVLSMKDRYSATSVIVLEPGNTTFDTVSARLRAVDPSVAQTEVEVLRSRQFAESIAERMELFDDPSFAPQPGNNKSILSRLLQVFQPESVSEEAVQIIEESDSGGQAGELAVI